MRCPKCGTENADGRIVCRSCGTRLRTVAAARPGTVTPESDEELARRVSYDLIRIVGVMAAVIIVGLGLGILLK
jgi:uncharacterized membrane protein YvbJ